MSIINIGKKLFCILLSTDQLCRYALHLGGAASVVHKSVLLHLESQSVELYSGQKLAADVIDWLSSRGFRIKGMYNPSYDNEGRAIQADFLFRRQEVNEIS